MLSSHELNEGLKIGELEKMISFELSIDEYRSKVMEDDESIVIVFRAENRDALYDLGSFIERGPYPVVDTEVSDRLDKNGFYLLFIEMERNKKFVKHFLFMMSKINNLLNSKMRDWHFTAFKMAGTRELSSKNLFDTIRLQKFDKLPKVKPEIELDPSDKIVLERIKY